MGPVRSLLRKHLRREKGDTTLQTKDQVRRESIMNERRICSTLCIKELGEESSSNIAASPVDSTLDHLRK